TQTPRQVVEAVEDMYYLHKANVHRGVHTLSQEATEMMEATRREVADFIGAPSTQEVIFTRGTTEAINLVASSFGQLLGQGDEIILSVMEHHANIVPWQLLRARRGVVIKVVPMLPDGSLDMHAYRSLLSPRTRMVAITHVSNVLGTVNPVAEIIRLAHEAGAVCLIDGAQAIAHIPVDVAALGADFYVFSSHKMYGPCGIGVLYGRRELLEKMPPYQGGGEMIGHVTFEHTTWAELPFKFEAGTPDYVGIAAFRQALAYIQAIGLDAIASHEERLLDHASRRIAAELPQVTVYGTAPGKAAIISFNLGNAHPYDTGMLLDKLGIACRTGHHCAQPLMAALGIEGTVRASFALYNTIEEADAFVDGLLRIAPMLT
ncbi:cysteine desulfurase, partial [Muribaculum intestinale]|uniref:cysteine desulfurase n=1 Tax=Muribaculum intestinale TaxID=1796646 RepID=UPI0025A5D9C4